jgi:fimbrial chaperone protein
VVIAIQFGIPIFSKPIKEEISGVLDEIHLRNGTLNLTVNNTGNTHFRISTVILKGSDQAGAESFSQELNGWYLLSGAARTHSATIPEDICQRLKTVDVQVNADRITLSGKIDVEPAMCSTQ